MPISFKCPKCGKSFTVAGWPDQVFVCNGCGTDFVIATGQESPTLAPRQNAAPRPLVRRELVVLLGITLAVFLAVWGGGKLRDAAKERQEREQEARALQAEQESRRQVQAAEQEARRRVQAAEQEVRRRAQEAANYEIQEKQEAAKVARERERERTIEDWRKANKQFLRNATITGIKYGIKIRTRLIRIERKDDDLDDVIIYHTLLIEGGYYHKTMEGTTEVWAKE